MVISRYQYDGITEIILVATISLVPVCGQFLKAGSCSPCTIWYRYYYFVMTESTSVRHLSKQIMFYKEPARLSRQKTKHFLKLR